MPWDGKVFVYEKTRGGEHNKKCECWRRAEAPPADYTVKACGFRV